MSSSRRGAVFIHWGAWGDLYVSTAALREVCDEFADEPVWIIGSDKWAQIIDPKVWPNIEGIIASKDGRSGEVFRLSQSSGRFEKTNEVASLRKFLKGVRASFNTRTESFRYSWAPLLAGVPRRHGSAPLPWSILFYTHRAPWLGKDPIIHERDRMLQVIEAPGQIGELAEKWTQSSGLPRLRNPNLARAEELTGAKFGKYWLINPTASRIEKAWPVESYRELFLRLLPVLKERGFELRLLGAPMETEWLKKALPGGLSEKWIIQPPTILDLMDVLGGAKALITNTSSVQFLAPGLNVPTLTLMGRSNPVIWGPLGPRDKVLLGQVDPTLSDSIFRQEFEAYRSIDINRVFKECQNFLG